MEKATKRRFDLAAFLKFECPDIRVTARDNPNLRVDEYNDLLSNFINHAPNVADALDRIAALEGSEFDFQYIAVIKKILENMGCGKFMPDIDNIVESGKTGHNEYVASLAEKLSEDINNLYTRIKETETAPDIPDTKGQTPSPSPEKISLSKALALLEGEESKHKRKILAIDDSPVMLQTISSLLSGDYTVYKMVNPAMLEKFLEQITPELILLDIEMPDMNGFEVMAKLKAGDANSKIPVVFLSAMNDAANEEYGLELGAAGFIHKPFQANILREKVAKHIAKKELLQKKVV
jgi:CheY-like chemotaxis protein